MSAEQQVKAVAAKLIRNSDRWVNGGQRQGSPQAMAWGWAVELAKLTGDTMPDTFDAHALLIMRNRARDILDTQADVTPVTPGRLVTVAPLGIPCGWTHRDSETGQTLTCGSGKPAVHVLTFTLPVAQAGTALCGYHSPYDVTQADREAMANMAEGSTEVLPRLTVSLCGTFALGETVTHAEHGEATIVDLGSAGGILVAFPGGASLGVDEAHYGEWSQVRTDAPGTFPADVEMAEAERDEMIFAAERRAMTEDANDDTASTNERYAAEVLAEVGHDEMLTEVRNVVDKGSAPADIRGCEVRGFYWPLLVAAESAGYLTEHNGRFVPTAEGLALGPQVGLPTIDQTSPDGIEILRELLTLPTVTRKGKRSTVKRDAKAGAVHLDDSGSVTGSCGTKILSYAGASTTDPSKVTCKRCPGTRRYASYVRRVTLEAKRAEYARAGLFTGLVVRQITTGRMGVVTSLDNMITVGSWSRVDTSCRYNTVAEFDRAMEIVRADKLVSVGSVIVSNIGDEATVDDVTPGMVYARRADGTAVSMNTGELAAEISKGYAAVVPTSKPQNAPTAVYIRPNGTRQAVTMADMAQVGMRLNFGYGYRNNGNVVKVSPHAATVKRADGTQYLLTLVELVRELNRGNVSTFMPDAQGRPIGSWR